jgi:hypothetical protein
LFRPLHFVRPTVSNIRYSAYHIRRNDLQYKEVFLTAQKSLDNTRALLKPRERIYLATDETSPDFFKAFESEHEVFRWHDFFTARWVASTVSLSFRLTL